MTATNLDDVLVDAEIVDDYDPEPTVLGDIGPEDPATEPTWTVPAPIGARPTRPPTDWRTTAILWAIVAVEAVIGAVSWIVDYPVIGAVTCLPFVWLAVRIYRSATTN